MNNSNVETVENGAVGEFVYVFTKEKCVQDVIDHVGLRVLDFEWLRKFDRSNLLLSLQMFLERNSQGSSSDEDLKMEWHILSGKEGKQFSVTSSDAWDYLEEAQREYEELAELIPLLQYSDLHKNLADRKSIFYFSEKGGDFEYLCERSKELAKFPSEPRVILVKDFLAKRLKELDAFSAFYRKFEKLGVNEAEKKFSYSYEEAEMVLDFLLKQEGSSFLDALKAVENKITSPSLERALIGAVLWLEDHCPKESEDAQWHAILSRYKDESLGFMQSYDIWHELNINRKE